VTLIRMTRKEGSYCSARFCCFDARALRAAYSEAVAKMPPARSGLPIIPPSSLVLRLEAPRHVWDYASDDAALPFRGVLSSYQDLRPASSEEYPLKMTLESDPWILDALTADLKPRAEPKAEPRAEPMAEPRAEPRADEDEAAMNEGDEEQDWVIADPRLADLSP
jgi:hypothetical protein